MTKTPLSTSVGYGVVVGLGFLFAYVYLTVLTEICLLTKQVWHDYHNLRPQKVCIGEYALDSNSLDLTLTTVC